MIIVHGSLERACINGLCKKFSQYIIMLCEHKADNNREFEGYHSLVKISL